MNTTVRVLHLHHTLNLQYKLFFININNGRVPHGEKIQIGFIVVIRSVTK